MANRTTPAAALTDTLAEVEALALDHAMATGIDDASAWAAACRWVVYMLNTQFEKFTISHGSTFECIMLAQMGFLAGPTDIHEMACTDAWTLAARFHRGGASRV